MISPKTEKELYIKEMAPGIYLLDEAHEATGYLVIGKDKACVIDTMNGHNNLKEAVKRLTDRPLILINTHGHPDHIYGNVYFEEAFIHPDDLPVTRIFTEDPKFIDICHAKGVTMPPFVDVHEGDIFDLGERHLEVYELPGHTPGSILLLLKEDRILFTGDAINHHLWMQIDHSIDMDLFKRNLERVMFLEEMADRILHGHAHDFDDISLMACLLEGVNEICSGHTENDPDYTYFGGTVKQHPFQCRPDKHYQQNDHVIVYDPDRI